MNRYPLWKYLILAVSLVVGLIYTLPNFFGEAPAVQVSSGKVTVKVTPAMVSQVETILAEAGVKPDFVQFDGNSIKARFPDTDTQIKAKDAISRVLNPDAANPSYVVAFNLISRSPQWLAPSDRCGAAFAVVMRCSPRQRAMVQPHCTCVRKTGVSAWCSSTRHFLTTFRRLTMLCLVCARVIGQLAEAKLQRCSSALVRPHDLRHAREHCLVASVNAWRWHEHLRGSLAFCCSTNRSVRSMRLRGSSCVGWCANW